MDSTEFYELLSKKLAGEATSAELLKLQAYLNEFPSEVSKAEAFSYFFNEKAATKKSSYNLDSNWNRHIERLLEAEKEEPMQVSEPIPSTHVRYRYVFGSSCILFMIVLFFAWYNDSLPIWHHKNAAITPIAYEAGSKRTKIILKDGTIVWLNQNSRIYYNRNFGQQKRELTLVGEAFFDVFHNPAVPMIVHTNTIDITVKGTAFNVMAYPGDKTVETSLIRGSVQLCTRNDRKMTILLKPNEKIIIPVNENPLIENNPMANKETLENKEILYSINHLKPEKQTNLIPEIAWIEDKLIFQGEKFSQVALKLQRFYGVPVEISDLELAKVKLTGVFFKETLQEALAALQMTYKFQYETKEGKIFLYK